MFTNTLSFLFCRKVSDQISRPHKTTGKIILLHSFTFKFLDSNLEDKRSVLNDSKRFLTSISS
jgi:hypothetical protein